MKHDVEACIRDASASVYAKSNYLDPLWWKDERNQYPRVSLASWKWLSVCTTLAPSVRVFSICGIVNSAKRNRTKNFCIQISI